LDKAAEEKETLKTYKGFPHGMPTTEAGTIKPTCWHSSKASHRPIYA
jgi:hypothetical protein